MDLRRLRYFAAVAETCHFGQAAERLLIAQPALSQAIRQLEAEVGVPLFTRTTRKVRLTPAGEFFHDEVRRMLASLDATVEGVRRIAGGRTGLVRVGLTGTAAFSHLPGFARILKSELPEVALEVRADLLTPAQCQSLRDGDLDLGLLRPPAVGDGIGLRVVESEPLVLALPADHPLAGDGPVPLAELRNEPFVLYAHRDSVVNDAVLRACGAAGFMPHREHEAPGTSVMLALVAAGLGVALLPAGVRRLPLAGVVFCEVPDGGTVDLALAWRDGEDNPLVASVLDVLAAASFTVPAVPGSAR